ncbi:MAG TPA: single-stranded-DNA-specific exonuclease RecJ [Capsulimonadaceae bacterium]|nr:single-stranded-DNA-specific exonuclease RecJ [Capsulimonadaceae bacterium]
MDVIWKETPRREHAEAQLVRELGLHALTARLLTNRGLLGPDEAEAFLRPNLSHLHDPFGLPDMDKAAHRIADAVRSTETIFIHGDYDVDGVTSTALYVRALAKLGAKVLHRVPHRHQDGYDLKARAIEWAHAQGAALIITTDCGIQAREAVNFANSLGMTVIVTDHHEPGETLPDAFAVVNPHRRDSTYPFPFLAGVGVAYKTMQAVTRLLKPEWENAFVQSFLDLVATGTVADVMPLLGENRIFAYYGLEALWRSKKVGLRALLDGARIDVSKRLTTEAVGFGIGPRINAVGRLDDAAIALDLMLTTDADEARRLVDRLNECNVERQQAQKRITAEAILHVVQRGLAKKPVVVVASAGWNAGVVGIVAGKLVEQFHRPAIVIGTSEDGSWGKGSARSIAALDIFQAISECRDLLETCGGHAYAAGLSLTMDRFEDFYERLCAHAEARLTPDDFRPQISLDAIVAPHPLDVGLLDEWEQLEPYGEANPAPILASRAIRLCGKRRIGKDLTHLKLVVSSGEGNASRWQAECVAWGRALDWHDSIDSGDDIDIAYVPTINSYNGRRSLQLVIKDLRRQMPVAS